MANRTGDSLRLRWLETFLAVVDHDCVDAYAARTLGLHPSQVGDDLDNLRDWLRRGLFVGTYPKALTPFGYSFVATAQEIVNTLNAARGPAPPPPTAPLSAENIKIKKDPADG